MVGLIIAVIVFNVIAFSTNRRLTKSQTVHIWTFTTALQVLVDLYIDQKYHAYWYFTPGVDWEAIFALTVLLPPVNMMFLNWYPFHKPLFTRFCYFVFWVIAILLYEVVALLPEPWGYFRYGWWSLWHSALVDPILLLTVLYYYKWIYKMEQTSNNCAKSTK